MEILWRVFHWPLFLMAELLWRSPKKWNSSRSHGQILWQTTLRWNGLKEQSKLLGSSQGPVRFPSQNGLFLFRFGWMQRRSPPSPFKSSLHYREEKTSPGSMGPWNEPKNIPPHLSSKQIFLSPFPMLREFPLDWNMKFSASQKLLSYARICTVVDLSKELPNQDIICGWSGKEPRLLQRCWRVKANDDSQQKPLWKS